MSEDGKLDPTNELEVEEKIMEDTVVDPEDLNKKNYVKISPTFYIQYVLPDESTSEEEKKDIYKILNPKTGEIEKRELTDDEKREIFVREFLESKHKFKNTVHKGNKTITKFGTAYRKERRRKNRAQKASRKANR